MNKAESRAPLRGYHDTTAINFLWAWRRLLRSSSKVTFALCNQKTNHSCFSGSYNSAEWIASKRYFCRRESTNERHRDSRPWCFISTFIYPTSFFLFFLCLQRFPCPRDVTTERTAQSTSRRNALLIASTGLLLWHNSHMFIFLRPRRKRILERKVVSQGCLSSF